PLSLKETISKLQALKVFVLPGNSALFVDYKLKKTNTETLVVNIFNLLGEKVFSITLRPSGSVLQDFISLPNRLPKGVYLIQIIEANEIEVEKFIVD
ncbi:MAG: T9SS type A sorting domain-containing protein, partial [Candidatus Kapaibacteriota bacterium]